MTFPAEDQASQRPAQRFKGPAAPAPLCSCQTNQGTEAVLGARVPHCGRCRGGGSPSGLRYIRGRVPDTPVPGSPAHLEPGQSPGIQCSAQRMRGRDLWKGSVEGSRVPPSFHAFFILSGTRASQRPGRSHPVCIFCRCHTRTARTGSGQPGTGCPEAQGGAGSQHSKDSLPPESEAATTPFQVRKLRLRGSPDREEEGYV